MQFTEVTTNIPQHSKIKQQYHTGTRGQGLKRSKYITEVNY